MINNKRQTGINLIATMVSFSISMGVSFFLTPYITNNIGVEAFGFISLGANFINYASLVTIALNSMAARFISIEIHRDNWDAANKYFSTVLVSNIIIATLMLVPSILCVVYLDRIVNVPVDLLSDVRLLFLFLFANYIISAIASTFGVVTFVTNRLYLKSLWQIEARVIRVGLLILLFAIFKPRVSFVGLSILVFSIYVSLFDIYYVKKLLPKIKISIKSFDKSSLIETILSGVWHTIIKAGQLLLEGVDLLISNLFIGAAAMGVLAVAKTVPMAIGMLIGTVSGVFLPNFTQLYAKGKTDDLVKSIRGSMKIIGIISNLPIIVLSLIGVAFFKLWVPAQNPLELQILSLITVGAVVITGPMNGLFGVFTITNRVKTNALLLVATGVVNIAIVFLLLKITSLGIYAIAGVSSVLAVLRNLIYTVPFSAKYLGKKWTTFFPEVIKSVLGFIAVIVVGLLITPLFNIETWLELAVAAIITCIIGGAINYMLMFSRDERKEIASKIISLIKNKLK